MLLSVLIPTVPSRIRSFYPNLLDSLLLQVESLDVEVLGLFDNKKRTTGMKRNDLLHMARGDYIVFIDDDDRIADNYLQRVIDTITDNPNVDVITYGMEMRRNGGALVVSDWDLKLRSQWIERRPGANPKYIFHSYPIHVLPWRRELVLDIRFPDRSHGEENPWALEATIRAVSSHHIDEVLYFYDKDTKTSESESFKFKEKRC
jgi:glycosyltransferase involved in cell wall biosynthesis